MSAQTVLYCQGSFNYENPTPQQKKQMIADAESIALAGYTTVVLGQWMAQVDGGGNFNIYYGDTPYGSGLDWMMSTIPQILHDGGVEYVTLTFGPYGSWFDTITKNLSDFQAIIENIFITYPTINGLDFDIESDFTTSNQQTLATLADWVAKLNTTLPQILITTAPPYDNMTWWADLLKLTNNFTYFYLQSAHFTGPYSDWITGLPCDPSFLFFGFNVGDDQTNTTGEITQDLADTKKQYPDLAGAMFWKYEYMTPNRWQQAAIEGLQ